MGVRAEDLCRDDRSDAHLGQEAGRDTLDDRFDLSFELESFFAEGGGSSGAGADGDDRGALFACLCVAYPQTSAAVELLAGRQSAQSFAKRRCG